MKCKCRLGLLCAIAAGCAKTPEALPPPSPGEPVSVQLLRAEPALQNERFSLLLNFEADADAVFVSVDGSSPVVDSTHAHSGKNSVMLPIGTHRVAVRLGSVLSGRSFPADWTMAGGYFFCDRAATVSVAYVIDGRIVLHNQMKCAAGTWTRAGVDLTAATNLPGGGELVYEFPDGAPGPVWLDDVMLVNNDQTLVDDSSDGAATDVWTIRRHGFNLIIERPGGLKKVFKTIEAREDGWQIEEANAIRVRLVCSASPSQLTLYADGRQFEDAHYNGQWVVSDPWANWYESSHLNPAELSTPAEEGRLDRNTPGDLHNDGYNERLGSYELVAFGRHMEIKIMPKGVPAARPVFEIAGLPAGKVMVTLEGELIEQVVRLPGGHVLIELPAKVLQPAMLNVSVK